MKTTVCSDWTAQDMREYILEHYEEIFHNPDSLFDSARRERRALPRRQRRAFMAVFNELYPDYEARCQAIREEFSFLDQFFA